MSSETNKTEDRITIRPLDGQVNVALAGSVLASSDKALVLSETGYDDVVYIPRKDVYLELMTREEKVTTCPHKGEAHYYRVSTGGFVENHAAWTYEDPKPGVKEIDGHIAFDSAKVDISTGPLSKA